MYRSKTAKKPQTRLSNISFSYAVIIAEVKMAQHQFSISEYAHPVWNVENRRHCGVTWCRSYFIISVRCNMFKPPND
jgi:hypothetical protein